MTDKKKQNQAALQRETTPETETTPDYTVVRVFEPEIGLGELDEKPDYMQDLELEAEGERVASGTVSFYVELASGDVLLTGGCFEIGPDRDGDLLDNNWRALDWTQYVSSEASSGLLLLLSDAEWQTDGDGWTGGNPQAAPEREIEVAARREGLASPVVKKAIWQWFRSLDK